MDQVADLRGERGAPGGTGIAVHGEDEDTTLERMRQHACSLPPASVLPRKYPGRAVRIGAPAVYARTLR
ncbi:hypothetical protein GCM10018782_38520 [Streptomyces griseoaurantiacus]|nr:hypothetical protein GCM10018782_38520 [Streptomyces griseoaurantiacus]